MFAASYIDINTITGLFDVNGSTVKLEATIYYTLLPCLLYLVFTLAPKLIVSEIITGETRTANEFHPCTESILYVLPTAISIHIRHVASI